MLGRLQFLESLEIGSLVILEYIEKGSRSSYGDEANSGTRLFPSLEVLELFRLPKLKGWWRGDAHTNDDERSYMSISFPHLRTLKIQECPLLMVMPHCPVVETLKLYDFNERLEIIEDINGRKGGGVREGDGQMMHMTASVVTPTPKLTSVCTDDVVYLSKSLPLSVAFLSLSDMIIRRDQKVENLREVEQVFQSCSSLQHLGISDLQKLHLYIDTDNEMMRCRLEEEDEIPWSGLRSCLHTLYINYVPRGLRHLTSLQSLVLMDHRSVKKIPDWIACLSSLRRFDLLSKSEELHQRCKSPDGLDWSKIQHIPYFCIWGGDELLDFQARLLLRTLVGKS